MSETFGTFKRRVRRLVNSVVPGTRANDDEWVRELTSSQVQMIGAQVDTGTQWLASPVVLVPGTGDYTISGSGVQPIIVRRGSDKWPLLKRTVQDQAECWIGTTTPTGNRVVDYSIWEDDSQVLNLRVRPIPTQADTLEIFCSDLPSEIASDTTSIPYSPPLIAALAKMVSADCLVGYTPAKSDAAGIDAKAMAKAWYAQAQDAISQEISRVNRLKRISYIQRVDI